jgi:hypothetical protein
VGEGSIAIQLVHRLLAEERLAPAASSKIGGFPVPVQRSQA